MLTHCHGLPRRASRRIIRLQSGVGFCVSQLHPFRAGYVVTWPMSSSFGLEAHSFRSARGRVYCGVEGSLSPVHLTGADRIEASWLFWRVYVRQLPGVS